LVPGGDGAVRKGRGAEHQVDVLGEFASHRHIKLECVD
jgi:hypothetical protein